jgi:hypothetical protein
MMLYLISVTTSRPDVPGKFELLRHQTVTHPHSGHEMHRKGFEIAFDLMVCIN